MSAIDLGNGQTVARTRVQSHLLRSYDQAAAALEAATSAIRSSVRPLTAMQAPADFTGRIECSSAGQSGYVYQIPGPGDAVLVDPRDFPIFGRLGFVAVKSGPSTERPTKNIRAGLVFNDTTVGSTVRWDGSEWKPVTLL